VDYTVIFVTAPAMVAHTIRRVQVREGNLHGSTPCRFTGDASVVLQGVAVTRVGEEG
jgi:hypothetical protein